MRRNYSITLFMALAVVVSACALNGCARMEEGKGASATASNDTPRSGKFLNTTASEEARKEFLQGRDLAERLLIQDSIQHFDKAIALDPNFALAELNRANVSPTG